jgi:hypothetical protein
MDYNEFLSEWSYTVRQAAVLYHLGPVAWENLTASYVESFGIIEGNGLAKGGTADAHLVGSAIKMLQLH